MGTIATERAIRSDLDSWLEKAEALGELKRITAEVDTDLEMAVITYLVGSQKSPAQSIDILRETWSTYLDLSLKPPEIRPWGSKCLSNACMDYWHIGIFSKRSVLAKSTYENVVARWKELGLEGKPPKVSVFEQTDFAEKIGEQSG